MSATTQANENIKARLDTFPTFHPATAKLFAGWTLDPGDIVTVKSDDTPYQVPIYQMALDWKGTSQVEISSSGKEKRPPLSELKRRSYANGKRQEEDEKELVRHQADIEKSNERISLWATEEEWDAIQQQWITTHKSELEIINDAINARVTQTALNTTLAGYMTISATETMMGNVMSQDGKVTAASIATAINLQTGVGTVKLTGDMIELNGNVTLNGAMSITGGELVSDYPISSHSYLKGQYLTLSDGTNVDSIQPSDVGKFVKSMTLTQNQSTGVCTLAWTDGLGTHSETFSRAATPLYISGSWNSGVYTAEPDAQSSSTTASTTLHDLGLGQTWTISGSDLTNTFDIGWQEIVGGEPRRGGSTGKTGTITVPVPLQSKTFTTNGSKTPDSGYIGFSSVSVNVPTGSATVTGFTVTDITANNPTGGSMFTMTVEVILSNGTTGTLTIPIDTSWDNSDWSQGSTTIEYYKKIGEVSGPLKLMSGNKSAARKLTISSPKADSVTVVAAGYRVHYNRITSGQTASEIFSA